MDDLSKKGVKRHKCDQCEKCFAASGGLKKHKRTHTGEKPFKCDQCEKCFTDKGGLTSHKRTHTGERPFKCDHCLATFSTLNGKKLHHNNHEEQKNYKFVCSLQMAERNRRDLAMCRVRSAASINGNLIAIINATTLRKASARSSSPKARWQTFSKSTKYLTAVTGTTTFHSKIARTSKAARFQRARISACLQRVPSWGASS